MDLKKSGRGSSLAMRCNFTGANNVLLSAYPWTGVGNIRPGSSQWASVTSFFDGVTVTQHKTNGSNQAVGVNPGAARTTIDLGSPMRRAVVSMINARVDTKMDTQFIFRVPGAEETRNGTFPAQWPEYHSVQILRNYGSPAPGSPAMHYMSLWGSAVAADLLGQVVIKSEITWAALTSYTAYDGSARQTGNYFVGHSVIPATPNGYQYVCEVGGNSAAAPPSWPLVVGQTVTESTGVRWRCEVNVDYQTTRRPLEVIDTGRVIKARFGGIGVVANDERSNQYSRVGLWTYYSPTDSKYGPLECWT
jgi:hypothetical protein